MAIIVVSKTKLTYGSTIIYSLSNKVEPPLNLVSGIEHEMAEAATSENHSTFFLPGGMMSSSSKSSSFSSMSPNA